MKSLIKTINFREFGILYALLILWAVLFILSDPFRSWGTYNSILRQASFAGICGVGMTLCIASKHFDQSIGAMTAMLGCTFTAVLSFFAEPVVTDPITSIQSGGITPGGILASVLIVIALGIVCGAFNGILVAKLKIPAFIATLGALYVYRGMAYIVSDSSPVIINQVVTKEQNEFFTFLGMGNMIGLPFSFWVMTICAIAGTVILRRTQFGRETLAIGNSVNASRISGIRIDFVKILIFVMLGGFVAIGCILNTSFLASSNPGMVTGFEFTVITTVVLGGTALAGGKGSVFNTIIAAHFLVSLTVGMNALGVSSYYQRIVQGVILLFAFSLNRIREIIEDYRVKKNTRKGQQQAAT